MNQRSITLRITPTPENCRAKWNVGDRVAASVNAVSVPGCQRSGIEEEKEEDKLHCSRQFMS
jgi:hypothetical protein